MDLEMFAAYRRRAGGCRLEAGVSASMSAYCQEGASPSRAIALRARNGMLLRRREAGWGAQEMGNQSVC